MMNDGKIRYNPNYVRFTNPKMSLYNYVRTILKKIDGVSIVPDFNEIYRAIKIMKSMTINAPNLPYWRSNPSDHPYRFYASLHPDHLGQLETRNHPIIKEIVSSRKKNPQETHNPSAPKMMDGLTGKGGNASNANSDSVGGNGGAEKESEEKNSTDLCISIHFLMLCEQSDLAHWLVNLAIPKGVEPRKMIIPVAKSRNLSLFEEIYTGEGKVSVVPPANPSHIPFALMKNYMDGEAGAFKFSQRNRSRYVSSNMGSGEDEITNATNAYLNANGYPSNCKLDSQHLELVRIIQQRKEQRGVPNMEYPQALESAISQFDMQNKLRKEKESVSTSTTATGETSHLPRKKRRM